MRFCLIILSTLVLAACTKGGKAEFFDGNNLPDEDSWKIGNSHPSVQFGIGGGLVIQSGQTVNTGYHASVLLKVDNGALLEGNGYSMTVNPVKVK